MLIIFAACEKDRAFVEFDDLEKGAYARLLGEVTGSYVLVFFDESRTDFDVEFYDEAQGQNIAEFRWEVRHRDNANDVINPYVPLLTVPSSSFGTSENGLPGATISWTFQDVIDALGYTIDDILGGDELQFNGTIVMNDGREFSADNTGNNIVSSAAFNAIFNFRRTVFECPSDLSGLYKGEVTYRQHDFLPDFQTATVDTVELKEISFATYRIADVSLGLYAADGPYGTAYGTDESDAEFTFSDDCGDIIWTGQTDPWQDLIMSPNGETSLDEMSGVITLSIQGTVYGEDWTVVLTPFEE